jgi:THAP4-like, heme-binding beta-barrel domain
VTSSDGELAPEYFAIDFLLGTWVGEGVGGYPGEPDYPFAQEVRFQRVPELEVFGYSSRIWDPETGAELDGEVGYWRTAGTFQTGIRVEVTIAHPTGIVEVYVGDLTGEKIELTDNVTVRTATARNVERSERLYAIVEGDLAYAIDIAAEGHDLRPHRSARLQKV